MRVRSWATAVWIGVAVSPSFDRVVAQTLAPESELCAGFGTGAPFGEMGDIADVAFALGLRLGTYLRPTLCIGAEYGYYDFPLGALPPNGLEHISPFGLHQFTAFGKFLLRPDSFSPYVRVLAGGYHRTVNVDDPSKPFSDTAFGFGGGGGLQWCGDRWGAYLDATVHSAYTETIHTNLLGIQLGIILRFGSPSRGAR